MRRLDVKQLYLQKLAIGGRVTMQAPSQRGGEPAGLRGEADYGAGVRTAKEEVISAVTLRDLDGHVKNLMGIAGPWRSQNYAP